MALIAEGANYLLSRDHLIAICGLLRTDGGLQCEHIVRSLGNESRRQKRQRREHNDRQSDERMNGQHDDKGAEDGQHTCEKLSKAQEQTLGKGVRVRDHTGQDLAARHGIQHRQRQGLKFMEGIPPQILHHAVGDAVVHGAHAPHGKRADHGTHHRAEQISDDPGQRIFGRVGGNTVDRVTHKLRDAQRHHNRDGGTKQCDRDPEAVTENPAKQAFEMIHFAASS